MNTFSDLPLPEQIWAIVGANDSGHSAMLRALEDKDSVLVSFRHQFRNLSNTRDFYYQQRFNSRDSEDALTVKEYLKTFNLAAGTPAPDSIINRLHLEPLLDEQVIKLSNGETKRLMIASALIQNPKKLLLDHPLTGLDVSTRADFNDLLKEISTSGTIVVIASSPSEVPETATHIALMSKGSVIYHGEKKLFDPNAFGLQHEVHIDDQQLLPLLANHDAMSFNTIVAMKEVTIKYNDRVILENINWTVKQGERWSLSGPNGAGKSTLLSLVNGDNPQAYANDIILFDKQRGSGESIWDIKKQTGFVSPEFFQYFPTDSTCLQVIESGFYDTVGLFRASDPQKASLGFKWMTLMKIDRYAGPLFYRVPPAIQRLCLLARALVKSPTLLILDEPTQGLDQHQQIFFTELIERICRNSGVTIIYVSHYAEHIPPAVTRHITLRDGRVESIH